MQLELVLRRNTTMLIICEQPKCLVELTTKEINSRRIKTSVISGNESEENKLT